MSTASVNALIRGPGTHRASTSGTSVHCCWIRKPSSRPSTSSPNATRGRASTPSPVGGHPLALTLTGGLLHVPHVKDATGSEAAVFCGKRSLPQYALRSTGFEARGFIIGAPVALALGCAFVLLRKPGKLPGECPMTAAPSARCHCERHPPLGYGPACNQHHSKAQWQASPEAWHGRQLSSTAGF